MQRGIYKQAKRNDVGFFILIFENSRAKIYGGIFSTIVIVASKKE